ncbi:Phosphatidylglycerol/phosphatidylinositol transfer protein [Apiospora arundinis]|uniref:Phosphatidylglycerol/phosphatidylinositol transfer protein n=1 Tax=Apiospora arundinis TaxID=335852 RepID=A0ABR2IVP7_9PEZI
MPLPTQCYALGTEGSYIYRNGDNWNCNFPSSAAAQMAEGDVRYIRWAALGPTNESYFITYVHADGDVKFVIGSDIPALLRECITARNPENSSIHLIASDVQVWLGPDDSFLLCDKKTIRWSRLPENLEGAVQSLLSPKGWIGGPPRIVTWNTAGAYCVVSESGEAWSYHIPDDCRSLRNSWDSRKMDKMLAEHKVQAVSFSVSDPNHYVFVHSDHHGTYGYNVPEDCEEVCEILDVSAPKHVRKARQKDRHEVKLRRELRDVAALKEELAQEKWRAKLAQHYYMWRSEVDSCMSPVAPPLVSFPQLSDEVCICEELTCKFEKEKDGGLAACEHDLEQLLRASGKYNRDWLRKERLRWHPDQFARKCDPKQRDLLIKQATTMYTHFETLIANELTTGKRKRQTF